MDQLTFAEAEYEVKKRKTRREKFLERMDALLPWKKLERQLAKNYSAGRVGRKPYPLISDAQSACDAIALQLERSSQGRCLV
jgi:hypothetical protein